MSRNIYRGKPFLSAFPFQFFFFLILACALSCQTLHASEEQGTKEIIVSASEANYPPFCIVNENNQADGFAVELLRASLATMGLDVSFAIGPWSEVKQSLVDKKVQVLPLVGRTPEREALFDFTFPYMTMHGSIVVRDSTNDIQSMADLVGKNIAVMEGDNSQEFIVRSGIDSAVTATKSFDEALIRLASGEFDAVVIQKLLALQLLSKHKIKNLKLVGPPLKKFVQSFCFAVPKGDTELLSHLNEGLSIVIANGTFELLRRKWFAAIDSQEIKHIVVGGDHNYPPYEFLDQNGQPAGYNVELTKAVARNLGMSVDIQLGTWREVRENLVAGNIDLIQGMFYSPERDKVFDFTPAHTLISHVGVTRVGDQPVTNLKGLAGKSIVVLDGDIMHDMAVGAGYAQQLILVKTLRDALISVSKGEADMAFLAKVPAFYWIEKEHLTNLHVGEKVLISPEYCYAATPQHRELVDRFALGLTDLKASGEYREIYQKWLGPYDSQPTDFILVVKYSLYIVIPLLSLLVIFVVWARALAKQVKIRTAALELETMHAKESEERFRTLVNTIPDLIWLKNIEGVYLACNEVFERLYGAKEADIVGKTDYDFVDDDLADSFRGYDRMVMETGRANSNEEWVVFASDGKSYLVETTKVPMYDSSGLLLGVLGVARDITARKEIEKSLEESEANLRAAQKLAKIGSWELDLISNKLNWSDEVFRIFGFKPQHIQASYEEFLQKIHPDDREFVSRAYMESVQNKTRYDIVHRLLLSDGSVKYVHERCQTFYDQHGAAVKSLGTVQDVTERKTLEAKHAKVESQLRQKFKMEAVGTMAGGIAHNFNNNLAIILGNLELLKLKVAPSEEISELIYHAQIGIERSRDLVKKIMTYSRHGKQGEPSTYLCSEIDEALCLIRSTIPSTVILQQSVGSDCSNALIAADSSQIQECLINLCNNAVQAMNEKGSLTVSLERVEITDQDISRQYDCSPGSYAKISVQDTGKGISEENIGRIFDLFFTTKDPNEGTGVGLSTVQGIVNLYGGMIKVNSVLGEGTTFELYFPLIER